LPGDTEFKSSFLLQKHSGADPMSFCFALVIAEPVVMIMQTTIIVQPIQRVTEVQIIHTVVETATASSRRNATRHSASFHPSGTGVFLGTGTAAWGTGFHGTAVSGMPPSPYNDSEPWTRRFL
jgi:hypothetical protein